MLKNFPEMTNSDISVIIPLYNKRETVKRAVLSILNQVPKPAEIIVVDDGSDDASSEIVEHLQENHSLIKLVRQQNKGVSAARNRGVKESKTEFVAFLDADDKWLPGYIEKLLQLYRCAPSADVYTLSYKLQDGANYHYPKVAVSTNFKGVIPDFISVYHLGYGLIHSSTVCFRKHFFNELGGFPEGESSGEDLYLWLYAALKGDIAFSNDVQTVLSKEPQNSVLRRKKTVPYHVRYFVEHFSEFDTAEQKILKEFLLKNIFLQWAAAKLENNRWQRNMLKRYAKKLSTTSALLLTFAEWLPSSVFRYLRVRRNKQRLNSDNSHT